MTLSGGAAAVDVAVVAAVAAVVAVAVIVVFVAATDCTLFPWLSSMVRSASIVVVGGGFLHCHVCSCMRAGQ